MPLDKYKDKVVLIVNTASKCGFTPQFAGLEKLYKKIKENHPDDFEILGFPCNQFSSQDPGSNDEIQSFCTINYGVSFPVLGKTEVNGDHAEPVYEWLKKEKPGLMGLKRIKYVRTLFFLVPFTLPLQVPPLPLYSAYPEKRLVDSGLCTNTASRRPGGISKSSSSAAMARSSTGGQALRSLKTSRGRSWRR